MTDRYERIRAALVMGLTLVDRRPRHPAPGADDVSPVVIGNATLYLGDCLEVMAGLPDASIDMILCDLPYGTTACKWDSVIPFDALWAQYRRILKPSGAAVLTCSQPFTSALIASNMRDFAYCWYWNKSKVTGFANAKKQPLRCVEEVAVFYRRSPTYNPQGLLPFGRVVNKGKSAGGGTLQGETVGNGKGALRRGADYLQEWTNYPRQVLEIASEGKTQHPTQKPVALMEYLIRTYTNEGEVVLDNCMGSGTTGVACANTGRRFIGIECEPNYFQIAQNRIEDALANTALEKEERPLRENQKRVWR